VPSWGSDIASFLPTMGSISGSCRWQEPSEVSFACERLALPSGPIEMQAVKLLVLFERSAAREEPKRLVHCRSSFSHGPA
jgi:hypothetical protein